MIRKEFVGDVLLRKFEAIAPDEVDIVLPMHVKAEGIELLQESEMPSYTFVKYGIDPQNTIIANCAIPSIKLQNAAVYTGKIGKINLATLDAHVTVASEHAMKYENVRNGFRKVSRNSFDASQKAHKSIYDYITRIMMYMLTLGEFPFTTKERMVAGPALIKYFCSKPAGRMVEKFFKNMGVDVRNDDVGVFQILEKYGVYDLFRDKFKKNPLINRTHIEVVEEFRNHILKNPNKGDLLVFGVKGNDISKGSMEFNIFDDEAAVTEMFLEFLAKKFNTDPSVFKNIVKTVAENNGSCEKEVLRKIEEKRAGNDEKHSHKVTVPKREKGLRSKLVRKITTYADAKDIPYSTAWTEFQMNFYKEYGVKLSVLKARYKIKHGLDQLSTPEYLERTGRLEQGIKVAEKMLAMVPV